MHRPAVVLFWKVQLEKPGFAPALWTDTWPLKMQFSKYADPLVMSMALPLDGDSASDGTDKVKLPERKAGERMDIKRSEIICVYRR